MAFVLAFLAGLSFSGHCALMCGVFPIALAGGRPGRRRTVLLQGVYLAGKTWAYVFLGVVAALLGLRARAFGLPVGILAAVLLVLAGVAGLVPPAAAPGLRRVLRLGPLCDGVGAMLRDPRPATALLAGIVNGFVPCAAVYAMLAYAAGLGSIPGAAATMLGFGLGTAPALAVAGLAGRALRRQLSSRPTARLALRAAAWAPIVLGLLTLARVLGPAHAHLGNVATAIAR